jgi:hypothetical protein
MLSIVHAFNLSPKVTVPLAIAAAVFGVAAFLEGRRLGDRPGDPSVKVRLLRARQGDHEGLLAEIEVRNPSASPVVLGIVTRPCTFLRWQLFRPSTVLRPRRSARWWLRQREHAEMGVVEGFGSCCWVVPAPHPRRHGGVRVQVGLAQANGRMRVVERSAGASDAPWAEPSLPEAWTPQG